MSNTQFTCDICQCTISSKSRARHLRSAKHINNAGAPVEPVGPPTEEQVVVTIRRFNKQIKNLKKQRDEYLEQHREVYTKFLQNKQPVAEPVVCSAPPSSMVEEVVAVVEEVVAEPVVVDEVVVEPEAVVCSALPSSIVEESKNYEPEVIVEEFKQEPEVFDIKYVIKQLNQYDSQISSYTVSINNIKRRKTMSSADKQTTITEILDTINILTDKRNQLIIRHRDIIDKYNREACLHNKEIRKKREEHKNHIINIIQDRYNNTKHDEHGCKIVTISGQEIRNSFKK